VGKTTVLQGLCENSPYHYPDVFKNIYGRNLKEKNKIAQRKKHLDGKSRIK